MTPDRTDRLVATLLASAFTAFFAATTHGAFRFGDDAVYFELTQALVERRGFDVTETPRSRRATRSSPAGEGRGFAKYGPGLSIAAVPAYLTGTAVSDLVVLPEGRDRYGRPWTGSVVFVTGLTNAVVGGLTVAALFHLVLQLGHGRRHAAIVATSLGGATYFAHYGTTFLSEPLSALLLTVAVAQALRVDVARQAGERHAALRAAALAGAAASGVLLVRLAHAPAIAAIGIWLLVRFLASRRPAGVPRHRYTHAVLTAWAAPVLLGVALIGLYNFARFANPFESGYGREAGNFDTPLLQGLAGLLLSPGKGWIWYAPPLLLAVPGWFLVARRRPAAAALSAGVLLAVVPLFARYYMWWGGGSWGPRFLAPVLPLALAPAAEILRAARRASAWLRALVGVPFVAGAIVVLVALVVPFDDYRQTPSVAEIRAQPQRPIGMFWRVADAPLVRMAREAPRHVGTTARLLVGAETVPPTGELRGFPDLAFARYRSVGLLDWTRGWLVIALLFAVTTSGILLRAPDERHDAAGRRVDR